MHLGMFDDLWSAASLVPFAREDGLDVFLVGNRNCPPFVRGMPSGCKADASPGYDMTLLCICYFLSASQLRLWTCEASFGQKLVGEGTVLCCDGLGPVALMTPTQLLAVSVVQPVWYSRCSTTRPSLLFLDSVELLSHDQLVLAGFRHLLIPSVADSPLQ